MIKEKDRFLFMTRNLKISFIKNKSNGGKIMGLENFKFRLVSARRELGYTQEDLAMRLGVTAQAISKWERGNSYPDVELMYFLAEALKCSVNYLYDYKEEINPFKDQQTIKRKEEVTKGILKDSILLEVGVKLIEMLSAEKTNQYKQIHNIRKNLADKCGILVPTIRMMDNTELGDFEYRISIYGLMVEKGTAYYPHSIYFNCDTKKEGDIVVKDSIYGMEGIWRLEGDSKQGVSTFKFICAHLQACILENYDKIINRQIVQELIDLVNEKYPAVIKGIVPEIVNLSFIQQVIIYLLKEHIAINPIVKIIELLEDNLKITKDAKQLAELAAAELKEYSFVPKEIFCIF